MVTTPDGTDDEPTRMVPLTESAAWKNAAAEQARLERAADRARRVRERLEQVLDHETVRWLRSPNISLGRVVDALVLILCEEIET